MSGCLLLLLWCNILLLYRSLNSRLLLDWADFRGVLVLRELGGFGLWVLLEGGCLVLSQVVVAVIG